MRIGEFSGLVDSIFKHNLTLLVIGPPGCGKTQIPQDYCEHNGIDCFALCMPLLDPPFLMGYPYRDAQTGHAEHAAFGVLDKCLRATRPTMLILDEIGGATTTTLKAALRLLQFGEVCGRRMPECVRMIALSNDVGHGADVMGILEPMKDRFISIINVEPNIDDTAGYALARNWSPWLIGFLRNDPKALHDAKPLKSMQRSGSTPRGWEYVNQLDKAGLLDLEQGPELIQGAVGKGHGVAALAFRALVNELPDIDAIAIDPEGAPIPGNPSAKFLVSSAIASKLSAGNFGQYVKYLNRMDPMFQAYSIKDAFRGEGIKRREKRLPKDYKAISSSRDFAAWSTTALGKEIVSIGTEK